MTTDDLYNKTNYFTTQSIESVTDLILYDWNLYIFKDLFDRANGAIGNNWTSVADGQGVTPAITSGQAVLDIGPGAGTSFIYRNNETFDATQLPVRIEGYFDMGSCDNAYTFIDYGGTAANAYLGDGVQLRIVQSQDLIYLLEGTSNNANAAVTLINNETVNFVFEVLAEGTRAKVWTTGSEPGAWTVEWDKGSPLTFTGDYLQVGFRESDGSGTASLEEITITSI